MDRGEFVDLLDDYAILMALHGENPFRVKAYQSAARQLRQSDIAWFDFARLGQPFKVAGVGSGIMAELREYLAKGKLSGYDLLDQQTPEGMRALLRVPGLGPNKVRAIRHGLGVQSLGELEYACMENRLAQLPGFGAKTQAKILGAITFLKQHAHQKLLADIWEHAQNQAAAIASWPGIIGVCPAGELARCMEVIASLSWVAAYPDGSEPNLPTLPQCAHAAEAHGWRVTWFDGLPHTLRLVSVRHFGAVVCWETGNDVVREALLTRAAQHGLVWTSNGLSDGVNIVDTPSEADFFNILGLHWVPPEQREDVSVLRELQEAPPPPLVRDEDLKGVFHVHTRDSDGDASLEEMVRAAQALGYQYIGISDHSEAAAYAQGLSRERIIEQRHAINRLNAALAPFRILAGIEADILGDGALDYDDETLAGFDFVIGSIHARFGDDADSTTQRLIRALSNPHLTILGHPTGRLLLSRAGYACDIEAVLQAAATHGKIIELNANPHRLDLDWRHLKRAKELGVRIAINPDAHRVKGLLDTRYGVLMARKAGLTPADIVNTRSLDVLVHGLPRLSRITE
jgi:DNA polymerase (family 10)